MQDSAGHAGLANVEGERLAILPHYRQEAENLLSQDLHGGEARSDRATLWLAAQAADASNASKPSTAAHAGVIPTPLNPATVDDALASIDAATPAVIGFVNKSNSAVDTYWINYEGDRVLSLAGLGVRELLSPHQPDSPLAGRCFLYGKHDGAGYRNPPRGL